MPNLRSAAMFAVIMLVFQEATIAVTLSSSPKGAPAWHAGPHSNLVKGTERKGDLRLQAQMTLPGRPPTPHLSHESIRASDAGQSRGLLQDKPRMYSTQPSNRPGSVVIHAHNEAALAQAISAATGQVLTTILLPQSITLTQPLPSVTAPLQLLSDSSSVTISCSSNALAFTALTIFSQNFSMAGLTWVGFRAVLNVTGASQVTIDSCSFQGNGSPTTVTVRNTVVVPGAQWTAILGC